MYDVLIIGTGTAGLTASLYANRAGLSVLMVEKMLYGGQILNTPLIENYPALDKVSGFEFVQKLYEQAVTQFDTPVVFGNVESCSLSDKVKTVTVGGTVYEAKTVIIATGAEHRKLGCPGEDTLSGKGVSYCATCDGAFFRGKTVAVVGGGNTALQDAQYLANASEKVYLIHRRDSFRATPIEVEHALSRANVEPVYDTVVESINGTDKVESLTVKNKKTGETSTLTVDGVFIAAGNVPDNQVFAGELELDAQGYLVAGEDCKTRISGVYAAGDTRTKQVRQLVTAAADGAVSAEMALEYINNLDS